MGIRCLSRHPVLRVQEILPHDVDASAGLTVTAEGHRPGVSQVVDAHHVLVKAGDDVTYWVAVTASDAAGNQASPRVSLREER